MFTTLRLLATIIALSFIGGISPAQRPRTQDSSETSASTPAPPVAPPTVNAKYEGGVFGYNKKMNGTLNFEDSSQRLVFRNKEGKEILFVPYNALTGAYGDTHSVRPAAATVASHIPVPFAGLAGLIKTKVKYLTLQYSDPDSKVAGTTSFKLDNNDILDSVLFTLANKAGLTRRGEVFIKKVS